MADPDDRRTAPPPRRTPALTADRIEQVRARIESGAYASESVLQATARAILERRDL